MRKHNLRMRMYIHAYTPVPIHIKHNTMTVTNLVVWVVPQVIPAVAGLEQQLRLDVPGEHNVRPVPPNAGSQLLSDGCLGIAAGSEWYATRQILGHRQS